MVDLPEPEEVANEQFEDMSFIFPEKIDDLENSEEQTIALSDREENDILNCERVKSTALSEFEAMLAAWSSDDDDGEENASICLPDSFYELDNITELLSTEKTNENERSSDFEGHNTKSWGGSIESRPIPEDGRKDRMMLFIPEDSNESCDSSQTPTSIPESDDSFDRLEKSLIAWNNEENNAGDKRNL